LQKEARRKLGEPIETVDHCLTNATIKMMKAVLINDPKVGVLKELQGDKLNLCL